MTKQTDPLTGKRTISFSPPDLKDEDYKAVVDALTSGWITTGPRTKEFEQNLKDFINTRSTHSEKTSTCSQERLSVDVVTDAATVSEKPQGDTHARTPLPRVARVAALSSCTAALECALHSLGIKVGDEVIVSAYTYTASASCIVHVGATPVLCDTAPSTYQMDFAQLPKLITKRTKAIICVDIAGRMVDYAALAPILNAARPLFRPAHKRQEALGRIAIIADGAHSLGATYNRISSGAVADLTAFSFHAVKNLTTGEGGALAWRAGLFDDEELYREIMMYSLHGQTKDALSKSGAGAWEYDIAFPGYKCNMTDIQAALGLSQLKRYPDTLARRKSLVEGYESGLSDLPVDIFRHFGSYDAAIDTPGGTTGQTFPHRTSRPFTSSAHLMLVRLCDKSAAFRNALIEAMGQAGVATNVHYKPLPLLSAYKNMGFHSEDFPHAVAQFENEITLPLYSKLSDDDLRYIIDVFHDCYRTLDKSGTYVNERAQ